MNRRDFFRGLTASAAAVAIPQVRAESLARPLRIGFLTDVHAMDEREAPQRMRETATRIADIECDLILGGGDFVHGGFTSTAETMRPRFELARQFLEKIGRPVIPMLGNHDLVGVKPADGSPAEADPSGPFRELFAVTETRRTFEQGGIRFFVLDTVLPDPAAGTYEGRVGLEQREWISSTLASTPKNQPIVLCSHIPFRSTFLQAKDGPSAPLPAALVVTDAAETLSLFHEHQLALVLQGHLHINELIRFNQTTFLIGGAVSGAWWGGSNLGTPAGFGLVELTPDEVGWKYQAT